LRSTTTPREVETWLCGLADWVVRTLVLLIVIVSAPISLWFCLKVIGQDERLVVSRLGRIRKTCGPGVALVLPCIERCVRITTRAQSTVIAEQQILTADGGIVRQGGETWWKVTNPLLVLTEVCDLQSTISTLIHNTFNNTLRKQELDHLTNRAQLIAATMQEELNEVVESWGVEITSVILSPVHVLEEPKLVSPLQPLLSALQGDSSTQADPLSAHMSTTQFVDRPSTSSQTAPRSDWRHMLISRLQAGLTLDMKEAVIAVHVDGQTPLLIAVSQGGVTELTSSTPADVTVSLAEETLHQLVQGEISPTSAWWKGLVRIQGDPEYLQLFSF